MRNAILLSLFALVIIGASTLGPYWFLKSEVKRMDFRNDILSVHLSGLQDRQELLESRIAKLEHDSVIPPAIKTNLLIEAGVVSGRFITNHTALIIHPNNQVKVGKTLEWMAPTNRLFIPSLSVPGRAVFHVAIPTNSLRPSPSQRQSVTHR